MAGKRNVLVVSASFPPATKAGGPARSVSAIVDLESSTHDIAVITSDRDLGDQQPYASVPVRVWTRTNAAEVLRIPPSIRYIFRPFLEASAEAHLVYLNSLFSPAFSLLPLIARLLRITPRLPVLLAPRGELAAAALSIKSYKKRPTLWVLRRILARSSVVWHASSEREAHDISRFMGTTSAHIIVRTNPAPEPQTLSVPGTQILTIVFLGRMAPIKNFEALIDAAAMLSTPLRIVVAGNLEDLAYWKRCCAKIVHLSDRVSVTSLGHLTSQDVQNLLRESDAMVLPTRGENFGRAIAESMAVGCPVLIPDTTMWTPMIEAGAGWLIDTDDPGKLADALRYLDAMTLTDRIDQRKLVLKVYKQWWVTHSKKSRSLFDEALSMMPTTPAVPILADK